MRIIDIYGNPLEGRQGLRLASLLVEMQASFSWRILYRRVNEDVLIEKLNLSNDNYYGELNIRLFMVGEKGRAYLNPVGRSISDVSDDVFSDIFDRFHKAFTLSKNSKTNEFKQNNVELSAFFSAERHKPLFISKVSSVVSVRKRQQVRDYYYMLLHRIGHFVLNNNSPFVSTTEDPVIADLFDGVPRKNRGRMTTGRDIKMIIIPRHYKTTRQVLKTHELPYCKKTIYFEQKEYSFKGAITPNRILGYVKLETNEFVVSQSFLESDQTEEDIMINGINVDQTNFGEILRQTNYQRGCQTDEEEYYQDLSKEQI